jgi:hypothetical protein
MFVKMRLQWRVFQTCSILSLVNFWLVSFRMASPRLVCIGIGTNSDKSVVTGERGRRSSSSAQTRGERNTKPHVVHTAGSNFLSNLCVLKKKEGRGGGINMRVAPENSES